MADTANPRVTADMTYDEVVAEIGTMLQLKVDPRGSEVSEEDTNTRLGAKLQNVIEEAILALFQRTDSLIAGSTVMIKDTRTTGATTTASIAAGADADFEIAMSTDRVSVQWLRVLSNSSESGPTGRIQFFADAARTKQVYDSDLSMGDPAVPVDDFTDGMAWGAFADDGSGLEDDTLYGTITNGGSGASTFTVRLVALAY